MNDDIHPDLQTAQQLVYRPIGITAASIKKEVESADYGAYEFDLGHRHCKFRIGKMTPKKIGVFVTIWKRTTYRTILPYDFSDSIDLFIVSVRTPEHFGQFIFPKTVLYENGIVSKEGKGGKRAIRVYPPWVLTTNRQAKYTQVWQVKYFLDIPIGQSIELARARNLLL